MIRKTIAVLGAALMFALAATGWAADETTTGGSQAKASEISESQIRDQLALDGYTIQRMKRDGDKISVYATNKDGSTSKLLVDARTGQVTQATDDDDDDDD